MACFNIAICEDESYIVETISKYLQEYYRDTCLIYPFHFGEELLNSGIKFDIAFLDIELGDMNGIQLAKKLKDMEYQACIVFVTNYTDYWKQAFNVHAFEYLTKPIFKEELFHVLHEIENYRKNDVQNNMVRLKSQNGIVQVEMSEIIYFEFYSRKVKMVLDNKEYLLTYSLQDIENMVLTHDFAKPHRAYVANLRKIDIINKFDIIMNNGHNIPLAQKKAADFKRQFEIYLYSLKKRLIV